MENSFNKAVLTVLTLALCVIAVELIPFSRNQKIIGICNSLNGIGRDIELGYKQYSEKQMDEKIKQIKERGREFEKITGYLSSDKACAYLTGNIK